MLARDILTPRKLTLSNFISYEGTHVLKFVPGVTWVQGRDDTADPPGSNGSGKTSLFYAFTWCLQGKLPSKGFLADDVINWYEDSTAVTLELEGPETKLWVRRSKKAGSGAVLEFKVNDEKFKGDQAQTQDALDKLLGIDWNLFNAVVLLKKRSPVTNLYDSTPATRLKTVSTIIQDSVFQEAAKFLGREVSRLQRELALKEGELNVRQTSLKKLEIELADLRDRMARESNRVESLSQVVDEGNRALELEILKINDQLQKGPGIDATTVQRQLAESTGTFNTLQQELGSLGYRIKAAPELVGGKCPTCRQAVTADYVRHVQQEVHELEKRRQWVAGQLQIAGQRQAELQESYRKIQQWPREAQHLQSKIESLRLQAYANREGIDSKLLTQYSQQVLIIEDRIAKEQVELEATQAVQADLTVEMERNQVVQKAFSQEIRYLLIDELRSNMQFFADQDLARLGREGWGLKIEILDGDKETFNIEPVYDGERMSLPSDGQAYRFSLVTALALLKAIRVTTPHRLGILMIDDPVGELDDNGIRDVGELFQNLAEDVPVVMVSTPREVDFGLGNVVQVVRDQRGSRVK